LETGESLPSLDAYRRVVGISVVGLLAIIAILVLVLGLSWPVAITAIAVCGMAIIGGWLYLKWSRVVTDVSRDQPDTTRLKKVGHRVIKVDE
jgi:hypothetical protein